MSEQQKVHVRVGGGKLVTSYREAWKNKAGEPVYTWRVDGPEPLDFGTIADAKAWIDYVSRGESRQEREKAGWEIVTDDA